MVIDVGCFRLRFCRSKQREHADFASAANDGFVPLGETAFFWGGGAARPLSQTGSAWDLTLSRIRTRNGNKGTLHGSFRQVRKLPIRHTDAVSQKRVKSRNCLVDAKKQFKKTYEKLEANIRQKDDNNILKQMDVIWHHVMFGRLPIRRKISFIIDKHASLHTGELREYADGVCKDIEAFNAEIDRLHRLVFENRQIHF